MSGLDQMIQRIAEGAQAQVSEIAANAKAEADRILSEAAAEREAKSAEIAGVMISSKLIFPFSVFFSLPAAILNRELVPLSAVES